MKKLLITALVFVFGIIVFPSVTKAQTNPYVYNGGSYLNYALASQRARRMRNRHSTRRSRKRGSWKRRHAHHRRRQASLIENLVKPELFVLDLPAKTMIG